MVTREVNPVTRVSVPAGELPPPIPVADSKDLDRVLHFLSNPPEWLEPTLRVGVPIILEKVFKLGPAEVAEEPAAPAFRSVDQALGLRRELPALAPPPHIIEGEVMQQGYAVPAVGPEVTPEQVDHLLAVAVEWLRERKEIQNLKVKDALGLIDGFRPALARAILAELDNAG